MKKILLIISLLLITSPAWSATYFVRVDGSTAANCTGLSNAPYDPGTTGTACAFNHPFYFFSWFADYGNSGGDPRASGVVPANGDDLVIVNGSYNMGYASTWTGCNAAFSYGCLAQAPKDGSNSNHTRITGCSITGCSDPSQYPILYGKGGTRRVLNVDNADYVDIDSLNITDLGIFVNGFPLYSPQKTATENSAQDGIGGINWTNLSFSNLWIHGLYRYGMFVGKGSNISLSHVILDKNGYGGWSADVCQTSGYVCQPGANACMGKGFGITGTVNIDHSEIIWSGCGENPATNTYANHLTSTGVASEGCRSQSQWGGDGDGFGGCDFGGVWNISDTKFMHNVSDGFDGIYANRNEYAGTSYVVFKRVLAEGNAGQQLKFTHGAGSNPSRLEDSIVIGNCAFFKGKPFTCTAANGQGENFNDCRAGFAIGLSWEGGTTPSPIISNLTASCNGDVLLGLSGQSDTCVSANLNLYNSVVIGGKDLTPGASDQCGFSYYEPTCPATITKTNNVCYNFKEATPCLGTNEVSSNPLFSGSIQQGDSNFPGTSTREDYYTQFLLSGTSPALLRSDETKALDNLDFNGADRGSDSDGGAVENGSVPPGLTCNTDCSLCTNQATCLASTNPCYFWSDSTCHSSQEPVLPPIALDSCSNSGAKSGTSFTYSHTVGTLTNGILVVAVGSRDSSLTDSAVTGITYNGDALTKAIDTDDALQAGSEIWYLVNPDPGANNVVVTFNGSVSFAGAGSCSFSHVDQSTPINVTSETIGDAPSLNNPITTTVVNTVIFDAVMHFTDPVTDSSPGSSQTEKWDFTPGDGAFMGSVRDAATVGLYTNSWTFPATDNYSASIIAIAPEGQTVPPPTGAGVIISGKVDFTGRVQLQ